MRQARTRKKTYEYRQQADAGRPGSHGFEVPGYRGPMAALLDVIRFAPAILGVPRTLVLLFIAARTVAYRKLADAPSLAQIVDGVYSKQGTTVHWIRMGCGLKHSAAVEATTSLVEMGLLGKRRRSDSKRGNLPTQYEIRWNTLHSYLADKSGITLAPLIRPAEKGSLELLQTDLSATPLSAQRTSPYPPGGQEQYLDSNSARKSLLGAMSAFDNGPLKESNTNKADYSFASAKPAEVSEVHGRSAQGQESNSKPRASETPQIENVSTECQKQASAPSPDPPRMEPARPAYTRPWTAEELQSVYACGSVYMENDTPPDPFASNCELSAVGHTAAEVIECLEWRFAKKKYRPGGSHGPRSWNWFYTVIRQCFSATERGHLPE